MRTGSVRLSLLFLLACVAGCEKRVDGPTPTLASVAPAVVCDAQLVTAVSVTGTNLTPLPIRTLAGAQSLELPTLALTRSASLGGTAAAGTAIAIPDGPDDVATTATHRARWQSESAMAFDVSVELGLADGVYDLSVKNPDGQTAVLEHALAAVPPPVLTGAQALSICDDQKDQTLTLTGTGFLVIGTAKPQVTITSSDKTLTKTYAPTELSGCAAIATSVQSGLKQCTGVTFVVVKKDLPACAYSLVVTNPAPAACVTTQPLTITVNPPPTVTDNSPKTICPGGGAIGVTGTGFIQTPGVTLGRVDAGTVTYSSATQVTGTFGDGTPVFTPGWQYDLTLTNPDGCNATLPSAVTVVPGPTLFFVDPPVVYNGITTQVTVYTTSVSGAATDLTVTLTNRATGAKTTLANPRIDTAHPKRILVNVPKNQAKGLYDVTVLDLTGCPATLSQGLNVVDAATVALTGMTPSFGWQNGTTAVKISAASGLVATPRAYLSPHTATTATTATALSSVAFTDSTLVTAIVPQGVDPASNPYDLIVVNPDATVGVLQSVYRSQANVPPVITGITPQSIEVPGPAPVTISGQNFRGTTATSNPPAVVFSCTNANTGATQNFTLTAASATATSITVTTTPLAALSPPSLCTITVTNNAAVDPDQPFATFQALAISQSSGNLSTPGKAGANLPAPRRGLSLVSNGPTSALRFLYALGGDTGTAATATDTVFTVSADERGTGTAWFTQRNHLTAKRTLGAAATLGRYIYVLGGNDGTGPVKTVERALVLDPLQAPGIVDVDIFPGVGGLGLSGGIWTYRVAALMDPNDPDNPGGETLPSDVQVLQLPNFTTGLEVKLTWSQVAGAVGYVIYRSSSANQVGGTLEYLAQVTGGTTLTFTDTGNLTNFLKPPPLVQGSTGVWKRLPDLTVNRESPGAAIAQDPSSASTWYLYATFGKDAAALSSYEHLPLTVGSNGEQTFPTTGTTWTSAAGGVSARSQHSTHTVTHANASRVAAGDTWLYIGGGTANGASSINSLEVGKVTAGGALTSPTASAGFGAAGPTIKSFGHGSASAANFLFAFGDETAAKTIVSGQIDPTPPAVVNINNNGSSLATGRYLPGSALEGALIYLAGGSNSGKANATTAVEWFVY